MLLSESELKPHSTGTGGLHPASGVDAGCSSALCEAGPADVPVPADSCLCGLQQGE